MDHGGMSVLAHVKVTPSTIPQLSNRPIMMGLLDQCVNYYYSKWPLGLKRYKMREMEERRLGSFTSFEGQEAFSEAELENGDRQGKHQTGHNLTR